MLGIAGRFIKNFQDAVRSLRTAGFVRTLQRFVQRVIPPALFDINVIIAIENPLDMWRDEVPSDQWQHRWGTRADMDDLMAGGLTRDQVETYMDADARPVISSKDGEFVGLTWPIPGALDNYGWMRVSPAPGDIWGGPAYTDPKFRGMRSHKESRMFAYPQLLDEGYKCIIGFVQLTNHSSLRVRASSARRYVGRIFYIRLLGVVLYRIQAKWGIGFWNKSRPYCFSFNVFDRDGPSRPPKVAFSEYKGSRNDQLTR